jgi:hypothetical protein
MPSGRGRRDQVVDDCAGLLLAGVGITAAEQRPCAGFMERGHEAKLAVAS